MQKFKQTFKFRAKLIFFSVDDSFVRIKKQWIKAAVPDNEGRRQ